MGAVYWTKIKQTVCVVSYHALLTGLDATFASNVAAVCHHGLLEEDDATFDPIAVTSHHALLVTAVSVLPEC